MIGILAEILGNEIGSPFSISIFNLDGETSAGERQILQSRSLKMYR